MCNLLTHQSAHLHSMIRVLSHTIHIGLDQGLHRCTCTSNICMSHMYEGPFYHTKPIILCTFCDTNKGLFYLQFCKTTFDSAHKAMDSARKLTIKQLYSDDTMINERQNSLASANDFQNLTMLNVAWSEVYCGILPDVPLL